MTTAAPATPTTKFSAARTTTNPDRSAMKTIITGDAGVGKTFFVSTIAADDGRPVFILPIEEGLKGASPSHTPTKFSDGHGNPILPATFGELIEALKVFRTEVNVPRPPVGWIDSLGYPDAPEVHAVLAALVDVFPHALPAAVLAERACVAPAALGTIVESLTKDGRVRRLPNNSIIVVKDKAWKLPHLHLAIDSLSGAETLIHREITKRNQVESMVDKDFNVLFPKALPLWQQFRDEVDAIRYSGVHVWLVAHSTSDIDAAHGSGEIFRALDLMFRGSGKALVEIRQFWRQWADSVLYIVRDISVQQGTKQKRATAQFRGRMLVTRETAQCRAKSRHALPERLAATWEDLRLALKSGAPASPDKLRARVLSLVPRLEVVEQIEISKALDDQTLNAGALAQLLSRVEGLVILAEEARQEAAPPAATTTTAAEDESASDTKPADATTTPPATDDAAPAGPPPAPPVASDAEAPAGM